MLSGDLGTFSGRGNKGRVNGPTVKLSHSLTSLVCPLFLRAEAHALEITSNEELIKERVKFRWKPKIWYTLKSRVDVNEDGSGVVRAKAWQRDQPEPDGWLLEVEVPRVNRSGSPGLYGFTPQSRFRCFIDNIVVTPND